MKDTDKIILVFPFNLLSHYLRCIRLSENYKDHTIFFARSGKYDDFVHRAGYATFEVENFDPETVLSSVKNFDFTWLNKEDLERIYLSQQAAIEKFRPVFVIGDACPTVKMAAESAGTKYISLINGYMSRYYAGNRYLPAGHFIGRFLTVFPQRLQNAFLKTGSSIAFWWIHRPFRQLRKKYALKNIRNYLEENEGDETLICDTQEFFPQSQLPANYRQIGTLQYKHVDSASGNKLTLFSDKKLICVSLGSSGDWRQLSFLNSAEYSQFKIIAAGDTDNVLSADHIITTPFIDLDEVLPKVDLLICHGGNGTVYAGLKYHKFILCITNHFEQEWNARRLEELGKGKWINKDPEGILKQHLPV